MEPYAPYPLDAVRVWLHRRRWWVRLAVAIVLVPWFGHFAYTRVTTPPAAPVDPTGMGAADASLARPDPAVDRTKDLVAAINRLPAEPTLTAPTTAPAGMRWLSWADAERLRQGRPIQSGLPAGGMPLFDVSTALVGEWTPATRYHLQQIVAYLESAPLGAVLDEIAALSSEPFCVPGSTSGLNWNELSEVCRLARLFTTRARYYLAEKNDFRRAARDIETALQLAAGVEDDQTLTSMLFGIACRAFALNEMTYWAREFDLTRGQAAELIALLERHRIDALRAWVAAVQGEYPLSERQIDAVYTKDEHGNGWLVLYRGHTGRTGDQLPRLLNLLSPLFEDRRSALDMIDCYHRRLAGVGGRSYRETSRALAAVGAVQYKPISRLFFLQSGAYDYTYALLVRNQALHAGAIVTLALSAYRTDHGQYPGDLSLLVPEYLPELPADPFTGGLLRYRLDEQKGYVLYSVDHNGVDDGGVRLGNNNEELDFLVSQPRPEPLHAYEWVLLPANTTDGRDRNAQPER